ncbi:MAG: hypothetical protein AAF709_22860 [Pseudomonadota bacterium]
MNTNNDDQRDPIWIWGGSAIAKFCKVSDQRAFYLLNKGELPAKKVGGRWVADRNALIRSLSTPDAPANQGDAA